MNKKTIDFYYDIIFNPNYVEEFSNGATVKSYLYWMDTSPDESVSFYLNKYIEVMESAEEYYIENNSIMDLKQQIEDYKLDMFTMCEEFKETVDNEIKIQKTEILEKNEKTINMAKNISSQNQSTNTLFMDPCASQVAWIDPCLPRKTASDKSTPVQKRAKDIHSSVREGGWKYDSSEIKDIPLDEEAKKIDCSSYVCNVLYEMGYKDLKGPQKKCWDGSMAEWCNKNLDLAWNGCTHKVSDIKNLTPGDIVLLGKESQAGGTKCEHVQIFSGYDNKGNAVWLSCGERRNDINLKEGEDIMNKTDDDRAILYVYHVK